MNQYNTLPNQNVNYNYTPPAPNFNTIQQATNQPFANTITNSIVWVETEEEYKRRQNFIHDMDAQHPETLTWDMIVAEGGNWSTLADSQHIVYNDKLLRV